ncbi:MAG: hypothetical protein QG582_13, partial [Candidatus Thermoplasmatota archaeon]|nr:hypothetical protein [Candidatus Thermoplasmatota archaeon]
MWRFLHSEMKVILGLVEDADRTDAEIADVYGMNKGTVAAVRRRLVDSGAVTFVNVPAFNKLGCELMAFHSGTMDPAVEADSKTNNYLEFCDSSPNVFHGIVGGGHVSLHAVFRDVTELETFLQGHNKFFSGTRRPSKAKLDTVMFPYRITRGTYRMNFAPTVHRFFEIDAPAPKARLSTLEEITEPDLSENERNTLLELVASPLSSDRQLASKVGLSRQAVTRIRRVLFEEGYLAKVCVPHLYKWGFELYVVSHAKFSMDMRWDIRVKSQPSETSDLPFFSLSKAD